MKNKKKKTRGWIRILAIVAIVIVAVVFFRFRAAKRNQPILQTTVVKRDSILSSVSGNGVLEPVRTLELKSNVGGQIVKLTVDEGDVVKAGQLIAQIDPSDTISALRQAEADYDSAKSSLDQAAQGYSMQVVQTSTGISSSKHGLESSKQKLLQAQVEANTQPELTSQAIAQAESSLRSAEANLAQIKSATIPQTLASAESSYNSAKASYEQAAKDAQRQKALYQKGFVPAETVDEVEAQLSITKAQFDSAKSKYDTVKAETDQQLRDAESKVAQARSQLATAKANRIQIDLKMKDLAAAKAAYNQAKASLESATSNKYQNQIKAGAIINAKAALAKAKAQLENAKTELGYTTITTPMSGVVIKKYVEQGSIVTAGRQAMAGSGSGVTIVDIADTSEMWVVVDIDETDIGKISIGQDVDVTIDAFPDELFTGKVIKIAPEATITDNVTTIPVTVRLNNADRRLKPEMNASCDFVVSRKQNVLCIPIEALVETDSGAQVTVLEKGQPVVRQVQVGLMGDDDCEIISGLREGETVVIPEDDTINNNSNGMRGPGPGGPPPM